VPKFSILGLLNKLHDLYKQLVVATQKIDTLREWARETIGEFKHVVERLNDKVERIERERVVAEAELKGRIACLEARLDALSAPHAADSEHVASLLRRTDGMAVAMQQLGSERMLPHKNDNSGAR